MKSRFGLFLSSLAILILSAGITSAAIIQVGPGGDLQAALDTALDGDTVQVAEGTYTGDGFLIRSAVTIEGGWNSDFTERDIANHSTVLQVTGWGIYDHGYDIIIDGLTIIGAGVGSGIENCCGDVVVKNCTVRNFEYGVFLCSNIVSVVDNCIVEDNTTGIYMCGLSAAYNSLIRNNGVGIGLCCGGDSVVSCTIVGNTTAITEGCEFTYVINSIIWGNTNLCDSYCDPNDILAGNWITYSDVQDSIFAGVSGNISADPLFNADYTLGSGSPCIDAGVETMLQYGPPINNELPLAYNGAAPDMGAYEVEAIAAEVDITHDIIDVNSNGNYIKCYIELPDGNAGDIDPSTVLLESPEGTVPALSSSGLGDRDLDGIADLKVKFDRSSVHAILTQDGETTLTVSGNLLDGTAFEGSDVATVVGNGQ